MTYSYLHTISLNFFMIYFLQESLVGEVVPDPMEGEQTWPTDEELKAAKGERDHVIFNRLSCD